MNPITQEVHEAIVRNLPQAVGATLQERLKKADADAAELVRAQSLNAELARKVDEANAKILQQMEQLKKHQALDAREAAVAERERSAELAEMRIKLEAAAGNAQFAREVALGLVRNTEYRHSIFESQTNRALAVPQGGMIQQAYGTEAKTVTTDTKAT